MTYSTNLDTGEGTLTLTKEENEALKAGKEVVKQSGDCNGDFNIVVELVRLKTKRFH